uniref:Uncharacterized protein n=1 Tax=Musa acuminata subsp. malaccensis TaxID=214687 RepID=A0A804JWT2_MUSAM
MITQSSFTIPAPAVCLPAFSRSQRLLEENRLHISRYGQWHSISFARQIPSSARLFAASLNARCSATQTESQTVRSKSATITGTPTKEIAFQNHGSCQNLTMGTQGSPHGVVAATVAEVVVVEVLLVDFSCLPSSYFWIT